MEHRLTLPARTIGVALIAISSFLNAGENRWDNPGRTAAVAHLSRSTTSPETEQAKVTSAAGNQTRDARPSQRLDGGHDGHDDVGASCARRTLRQDRGAQNSTAGTGKTAVTGMAGMSQPKKMRADKQEEIPSWNID